MKPNKPKSLLKKLLLPLAILAVALITYFCVDFFDLSDRFAAIGYEPTPALASFESDLTLTEKGKVIFAASRPELNDRDAFNANCKSHNVDISVLGCYTNDHIYVYKVDHSELAGIEQSTLAHELLHAVWARLPDSERNRLAPLIEATYLDYRDALDSELSNYSAADRLDELHSRIGTEILYFHADKMCVKSPCPQDSDALVRHYEKYFTNRAKIVAYFEAYNGKFQSLKSAAAELFAKIENLEAAIDAKTDAYYAAIDELNARIEEFNARAASGYFTTTAAFNSERNALLTESSRLTSSYAEIAALVDECNAMIIEYNNNLARAEDLNNSINSNLKPAPTL
jgi:outer membrane murein-binding lipoprotein Lpp